MDCWTVNIVDGIDSLLEVLETFKKEDVCKRKKYY